MKYFSQLASAMAITVILIGCGSSLKVNSQWRDRDIAIDGKHQEWSGGMTFFEDDNVAIGFFNDSEYLYISMVTATPDIQRQFMIRGFTLWFDPDGGKDRTFGIKFPVGMWEMGFMMRGRGQQPDIDGLRENFEKSLANIEIILPDKEEPLRMRVEEATGIEVKIGQREERRLSYEIKVPLRKDEKHPYAIAIRPDKALGVGFETAQVDREKMREQMSGTGRGGPGGGGFGDGRGGFGGGRGGMGGARPQMPEQFKLWMKVQLSTENQPSAMISTDEHGTTN